MMSSSIEEPFKLRENLCREERDHKGLVTYAFFGLFGGREI